MLTRTAFGEAVGARLVLTVGAPWRDVVAPNVSHGTIADKLSAAGWSWGYRSAVTRQAGGGLLTPVPNA